MRPLAAFARVFVASVLLVLLALPGAVCAQGIALDGAGPVNRAMAGAATAAPIDASGALFMNPASISGLECSEMDIGLELLLPTETLSSSLTIPGVGVIGGSTGGEPGTTPVPTMAIVHKCCDSPWTLGLGMFGIAGFASNYPASSLTTTHNPVLFPQQNSSIVGLPPGLGRINSSAQFFQIIPTASYAITEIGRAHV
jgi:long-chain fatty acid transport protein